MARPPKPWFLKGRGIWCVYLQGKQHTLGPDKDEALRRFHTLMAEQPAKASAGSIAALLDAFLVYCEEHKAPATVRWYTDFLQDFINYLTASGHAPASMNPAKLTPRIVRAWVDKRAKAKRGRITAVKAAYRWAHSEGWIDANPIAAMRRPPETKREEIISLCGMKALLRKCDRAFRELLIVAWDKQLWNPRKSKSLR